MLLLLKRARSLLNITFSNLRMILIMRLVYSCPHLFYHLFHIEVLQLSILNVNGEIIKGIPIFKIFMETSSYSYKFLDCDKLIIFSISGVVVLVSLILGKSFPKYLRHYLYVILYVVSLNTTIIEAQRLVV